MPKLLESKCALIIGASRGIGAATAAAFVANGARVALASRDVDAMERLANTLREQGGDVRVIATDVANAVDVERAVRFTVESFGRLDIAFNNAGVNDVRLELADLSDEDFRRIVRVNLESVFIAMKHELRAMLDAGGGCIVNTASAVAMATPTHMTAYVASKEGVLGLTRAAALEYASKNIRVNAIAPGAVMTDMLMKGSLATSAGHQRVIAAIPMGRIASPEEQAEAVVWLASEKASYVTGAILPVDGGYTLP